MENYRGTLTKLHAYAVETYRLTMTRLRAFYRLATMSQRDIDAFMNSYILFDGDWSKQNGKKEDHIVDYYRVINHLCAMGNVEKMYIPPLRDPNVGVKRNQELFEEKVMADIGVTETSKVLDIGCGRGRVVCHVATKTGANVTGINIDPGQIENGREYVKRMGLEDKVRLVQGSLNDPLPFPDECFDGIYEIQAFTYAKNREAVLKEVFRVLKPGGKFSYLDWVLKPAYNPQNSEHVDLVTRSGPFIGAVETIPASEMEQAMKNVGFKILFSGDASIDGHQASLIVQERKFYAIIRKFIDFGVKIHLLPKHFPLLMSRLKKDAEAFTKADELGIATSSYQIICQKPANS